MREQGKGIITWGGHLLLICDVIFDVIFVIIQVAKCMIERMAGLFISTVVGHAEPERATERFMYHCKH